MLLHSSVSTNVSEELAAPPSGYKATTSQLKMLVKCSCKMSVTTYQTTSHHIPENGDLQGMAVKHFTFTKFLSSILLLLQ